MAEQTTTGADRRTDVRTPIAGALRGEVMVYQPMAIKDISHGGAQVETAFPLLIDSLHDLRLELGDAAVIVKGRVVYCRIANVDPQTVRYRSGVEFTQPSNGVRALIAKFIDDLQISVSDM